MKHFIVHVYTNSGHNEPESLLFSEPGIIKTALKYHNDPKFSDRSANSADLDQTAPLSDCS